MGQIYNNTLSNSNARNSHFNVKVEELYSKSPIKKAT